MVAVESGLGNCVQVRGEAKGRQAVGTAVWRAVGTRPGDTGVLRAVLRAPREQLSGPGPEGTLGPPSVFCGWEQQPPSQDWPRGGTPAVQRPTVPTRLGVSGGEGGDRAWCPQGHHGSAG